MVAEAVRILAVDDRVDAVGRRHAADRARQAHRALDDAEIERGQVAVLDNCFDRIRIDRALVEQPRVTVVQKTFLRPRS